ncbi:MAG: hypothetical protein NT106_10820 [Candidatus Sumerlaeota bacterium]|nr:hypothetical protein [Candidatus Sumerlaeota bacterium]
MKRFIFTIMILAIASAAISAPYASRISGDKIQMSQGGNLTINYFINEAGGTATINIIKVSDSSVVATFTGTATIGVNSAVWNGTVNNASGAQVPPGNYRVKISLSATKPAGWTEIASNSSVGNYVPPAYATIYQTIWDGFSPMEFLIQTDTNKENFGYILVSTSYSIPRIDGHVVFNPDLSCYDGGNGQTTWLNFPGTAAVATALWGNCFDPDDTDYVWVCGQDTSNFRVMYGKWNDITLQDKTGGAITEMANARDISVRREGANKYAYVTLGSSTVYKCALDASNNLLASPINVIGTSVSTFYSKGVDFDSNGNMYYSVRYDTTMATGEGCVVYRWSAADVQSATANSLTTANAQWIVTFPTGASNAEGVAIAPDGNVYAAVLNEGGPPANDGSLRGIYLLGSKSTTINQKQLTTGDRVYAFYGTVAPYFSFYGVGIMADIAGNIFWDDRGSEMVRCVGPGGTTNVAVVAPTSQNFEIVFGSLAVKNWTIYE